MSTPNVLACIAIVLGLSWFFVLGLSRLRDATWRKVASNLGLSFNGGGMGEETEIAGKIEDISVRAETITRSGGKTQSSFTLVHVRIDTRLPDGLKIYHEDSFGRLSKVFGAQDIETGDKAFDQRFMIKGDDPQAVHDLLSDPDVKRALLYCHKKCIRMRVENQEVYLERFSSTYRVAKLTSFVRMGVDVALAIQAAADRLAPSRSAIPPAHQPAPAELAPAQPATADSKNWW